jgi:hypothetical protein
MILQELFEAGPGGSDNYAENLAQQVFNVRPNLRSEDDVLNIGYKVAVQDLASQTRAVSLFSRDQDFPSDFVSAYYYLQKQKPGVSEGLNEFAPGAGGGDDGDADPYRYPKPESYRRSVDFFSQFEADHFDREDFDDITGVFKGYWGNKQIAHFKFDNPAKTGSDDSGMGWYYEPDSDNGADTSANPAVDNSAQRKQQELSMIDAFLKSGQTPKPGSQIYGLMKQHGISEGSLNEFALPGGGDGDSGRWYTDDELADIIGDDWFQDFDVSHDEFNIDAYGEKAKQNLASYANSWFDDRGYNVNVLGVEHNDVDHDLKWYIVGSFQNDNFAKKDVPENSYKNSQAYRADGGANDENHELDQRRDQQEKSGTWYIRLNGKLIKDKQGNPYSFRGKAAANKAALTMQAKLFNQGKEFMLTTNPNDKPQGVAEGKLIESAVFLNPTTVIVGQAHGQPLELSPNTLKQIQAIAAKHGAYYEGNGTDRAYTKGQIDRYVGSWDDEVAKIANSNDPKWLYVLFANVDANNRVQRVGVDPKDTIFNRLLATAKDNSFQGIGYTPQALQKFLQMSSEGKYDFVKMSQQPATQENLTRFLKAGEALMWPSNWEQYPNKAGKIAKAATVDVRDQYLATRKAGVYVTGSGHLKAVQNITGKQGVAEGSQRVDSLVTDALKIMRGSDVSDAVAALKTVLGDREYNGRRGYYNFYVRQLMDMYGQQDVAEGFDGEYDDEAGMADNNLETLKRAVEGIDDVINAGDNLPEWCQEKIAVSKSMLVSVWDYMRSEKEKN